MTASKSYRMLLHGKREHPLPDHLAQQAQAAGLLRPETIVALLREVIRKRQADRLFTTMDRPAQITSALTEAEIDAQIATARL